jgi:hypothetical protein
VPGDRLVLADRTERVTQPGGADVPAADDRHRREDEQHFVDDYRIDADRNEAIQFVRDVDFVPARHLAHEFGEAKGENDEVDAAKAERRQSDDERKEETDDRGKSQTDGEIQADVRDGDCVHSHTDEGGGGQRNIASRARKDRPGRRQGDIGEVHDPRRDAVGRKT